MSEHDLRSGSGAPTTQALIDLANDADEIRSSYGFLMMRLAVATDAQDTYDVCKREWTQHEAAFQRLDNHTLQRAAADALRSLRSEFDDLKAEHQSCLDGDTAWAEKWKARALAAEAEVARLTQARDAALAMAAGHEETAIMQRRAIVALTQAARQVPPASDAASSVFDQAKCNTHADYTQESANPEVARLTAKLGANHD